jgi:hypothetical protein
MGNRTSNSQRNIPEGQPVDEQALKKRKKLNLYKLKPKDFSDREDLIIFNDLRKVYNLEGRDEKIVALKSVSLAPN